jgi:hypothetical protein
MSVLEPDPIETRLAAARERAASLQPYSPAWDAAMAGVDDLEHELRERLQAQASREPTLQWPARAF